MGILASQQVAFVIKQLRNIAATLYAVDPVDSSYIMSVSSLEKLPPEILDGVLSHLDTKSLAVLEGTSPGLHAAIQSYKAHCVRAIRTHYALENLMFPSVMQNGWLVTTRDHFFHGLLRTYFPMDGHEYYTYLRMYAAHLRYLHRFSCSLCLDRGFRIEQTSMYHAILVWSMYGWRPMSRLYVDVEFLPGLAMPEVIQFRGRTWMSVTDLPASLLAVFQKRHEQRVV